MRCEMFVKLFSVVTLEFNHSIIENMDVVAETFPTLKKITGAMDDLADKERIHL